MPPKTCPNCDAPVKTVSMERLITCVYCNHTIDNPFYEPPRPAPAPQPPPAVRIDQATRRSMARVVRIVVPVVVSVVAAVGIGIAVLVAVIAGKVSEVADTAIVELPPPGELGDYARAQKPVYAPGEVIVVDFYNHPGGTSAWIALARNGQPANQYVTYEYTGGMVSGQVQFDDALAPGEYEIRVFLDSGYTLRGVSPFRVDTAVAPEYIRVFKSVYAPKEPILVEYAHLPPNNNAWIAVSEAGSGDNSYVTYEYTDKQSAGRLSIDHRLKPGGYEVRIYLDSGYTVAGRIPITVQASGR